MAVITLLAIAIQLPATLCDCKAMHIPIAIRLSIIGLSACLGVPASATLIRLGIIGLSASPDAWATTAHVAPLQNPPLNAFYQVVALATSNKVRGGFFSFFFF